MNLKKEQDRQTDKHADTERNEQTNGLRHLRKVGNPFLFEIVSLGISHFNT